MIVPEPNFERLTTALKRGQPDRVPIIEITVSQQVMEAFLGKRIESLADHVEFYWRAGYDSMNVWPAYNMNPAGQQPKEGVRSTVFRRSVYTDEPESRVWRAERAGVITSSDELQKYQWPTKDDLNVQPLETIGPVLRNGMKAIVISSLHEHAVSLMGTETMLLGIYDQPELVAEVYRRVGELILHLFERSVEYPAIGALWLGDDLAYTEGLFFSLDFIRQNIFPWYRKIADVAKSHNLPLIFHSDGDIRPILPDLADIGFDAIHPIEPKAMDIVATKRDWGNRFCIIGNIDLCYTLPRGTPQEVEEEVRLRIEQLAPGGGYVLSSANSVPEYVPLPNYVAMVQAVRKYGTYG